MHGRARCRQVIPHTKPLSNSLVKALIRLLNSGVFEAKPNLITAIASFGGACLLRTEHDLSAFEFPQPGYDAARRHRALTANLASQY